MQPSKHLPNLPVYPAYKPETDASRAALIFAVLTLPITIGIAFAGWENYSRAEQKMTILLVYVPIVGLLLTLNLWLFRVYCKNLLANRKVHQEFQTRANTILATILGREREDGGEYPDTYFIVYQFRDDFIVRAALQGKQKNYYDLPTGSQIEVEYLPDRPTTSRLKHRP
jgi:hypothetical protein